MKPNLLVKQVVGTLVFFAIIFLSAGRIVYWPGLTYVFIGLIMLVISFTVLKLDSDLMLERSRPGSGAKVWDKKILGLSFLSTVGMYVVAGLDSGRYHWSPDFHWSILMIGGILTMIGQLLFLIAQKQNKFFSSIVRIQTDRGHVVCDTGLYKFVRHPAYLGSMIQTIGFPLMFGSLWSIVPVIFSIILLLTRTSLEDKTLKNELNGYRDYANNVKYRIFPYLW